MRPSSSRPRDGDLRRSQEGGAARTLTQQDLSPSPHIHCATTCKFNRRDDRWVLRSIALYPGTPRRCTAPEPPCCLHDERDDTFGRPLIWEEESGVRGDYANKREARKVERLCGKCRTDEQLRAATTEGVKDAIACADRRCSICIEAIHRNRREESLHVSLESLSSTTDCTNPRTLTGRATRQRLSDKATAVAAQQRARAVEHQRSLARWAGLRRATISAEERRRKTAAIDDQERLLPITPAQALESGEEWTADH
jgi:hypothetical protein